MIIGYRIQLGLWIILKLILNIESANGDLKFTAQPWNLSGLQFRQEHIKDVIEIDCQTNKASADVTLMVNKDVAGYTDAKNYFKDRMKQTGQKFYVRLEGYDGHSYRCVASDGGKPINMYLGLLFVIPVPRVVTPSLIPSDNPFMLELEGSRNLTCEARGTGHESSSYLKWYKKVGNVNVTVDKSMLHYAGETKGGVSYDLSVLMFKNVKLGADGQYYCVRTFSQSSVTSIGVAVQIKPTKKPTAKLTDISGPVEVDEKTGRIFATCQVDGSPKPLRNWYKDNKVVQPCPSLVTPFCYLEIRNVAFPRDNGTFICRARSSIGKAEVLFNVRVKVPVSLEKPSKQFLYGYDQTVDLYCRVSRASPLPTMTWEYQPYPCPDSDNCPPDPNGWTTLSQPFTVLPSVTTTTNVSRLTVPPSRLDAFYRCIAKNSFSNDIYGFTLRRLERKPPELKINLINPTVNEKDALNLTCYAQLNVFKTPYWTKDGKILPRDSNKDLPNIEGMTETKLIFSSVSLSDEGNFTCVANRRRGGQHTISSFLTVRRLIKPVIRNFNDQVALEKNGNASIVCNAAGNPEPTITWKFNNKTRIPSVLMSLSGCATRTAGLYVLQTDKRKRTLIICKLNHQVHAGKYTCIARHGADVAVATKQFVVYGAPKILGWTSTFIYQPGAVVTLFCESSGFPSPNVTWYKVVDRKYTIVPSKLLKNGTAIVEFFKSDKATKGNYSCISRNSHGKTERFVNVLLAGTVAASTGRLSGSVVGGLVATLVFVVICSVLFILWYKRRVEKKYAPYLAPNPKFQLDPDQSLMDQSSKLPYDVDWEFPRERLVFIKVLGSGAFGEVWLADAQGILAFSARDKSSMASKRRAKLKRSLRYSSIGPYRRRKQSQAAANIPDDFMEKTQVAVKTLKDDASESDYKDLASELKILIHLGEHKNIVNLLGACTQSGKLCVVIEYCPHGNLLNFLRQRREIFEPVWYKNETDMETECTYIDLLMAAYQIAKGMDFLASKKCVHRDLAARNVLVGVDYIVKIADFGLARDIYKDEFYLKSTSGLLPVKWMSPESLFDRIYTEQSDVWSYGILLWEIFTLGGSPYPGLPSEDLFSFLKEGRRMDQPELCPLECYAIMRDCWETSQGDRPLFSQIVDRLGSIMSKHSGKDNAYLDFNDGPEHEPQDTDYLIPEATKSRGVDEYLKIKDGAVVNGVENDIQLSPLPPVPSPTSDEGIGYPVPRSKFGPGSYMPMNMPGSGYSNIPSGGRTAASISSNEVVV